MLAILNHQMETPYRPPDILRLCGISLSDWVAPEDIADEKLLEGAQLGQSFGADEPPSEAEIPRDKIPRVFTGLRNWPRHTNLHCWQCDRTFDNPPRFVSPCIRETENGELESDVLGNMCTHNCAELWTSIKYAGNKDQKQRISENNRLIYFIFTGIIVTQIPLAPEKTEMRKYGGTWDEELFGKKLRDLDPLGGLYNHTPGSIVPERSRVPEDQRIRIALNDMRARERICGSPIPRVLTSGATAGLSDGVLCISAKSLWSVCGLGTTSSDSVPIDFNITPPTVRNETAKTNKIGMPKETPTKAATAKEDMPKSAPKPMMVKSAVAAPPAPVKPATVIAKPTSSTPVKSVLSPITQSVTRPATKPTNSLVIHASPQLAPASVPASVSASVSASVPESVPASMPAKAPVGVPAKALAGVPAKAPAGVPAKAPAGVPAKAPAGVPANVSAKAPASVPAKAPADVANKLAVPIKASIPVAGKPIHLVNKPVHTTKNTEFDNLLDELGL